MPSPERTLFYAAILASGAVALTFQIVWQKYLSFLVGSEARSISLVVAVFLFGLATGYRYWGNLTERNLSRRTILKIVGYIELGIALYALLFPAWFSIVRSAAYAIPDSIAVEMALSALLVDLTLTGLLLFLPTFLMGASIPLLTSALPASMEEVNYCHSRIYGINTLGAFAGTFIGGFFLLPTFGLPISLALGALVNMLVGLVFVANRLEGPAHRAEETPSIPNNFGTGGIYLFVFTTGAVSIAYEILFIRILGLSIGSGHYIFPIVVGVVILGLAIGSLSLRRGSVTAPRVMRELVRLGILLAILYFTVPYWPYWFSHVRISLATIPSNYGVFLLLIIIIVSAFLLPIIIPMGRLLPIGYSLIDKNSRDYGKVCGRIYFMNTMGTVVGAVVIAHMLFHFFDLETIFKLNLALVFIVAGFLYFRHGSRPGLITCCVLAAAVFLLPQWNRQHHYIGLFRINEMRPGIHFQGVFNLPQRLERDSILFFRDDPNVTVTVSNADVNHRAGGDRPPFRGWSIMVNGKSDGNTVADYSNMVLSGLLPYLYAHGQRDLKGVVIGLGTGMTTGAMAGAEDIASVTTLEISPGVIQALPYFDEGNFRASKNPKSRLIEIDAFRYFSRTNERFDVIASEPSNPWVVGVENLFTPEYYQLVTRVMNEGAVFFQWIQVYEINDAVFSAIVQNVTDEFPYVVLYVIGASDVGIVASHSPLTAPHMDRRLQQAFVKQALDPMGLDSRHPLLMLEAYGTEQLKAIGKTNTRGRHDLETPWLGHASGRARFLGLGVNLGSILPAELGRHQEWSADRKTRLERWLAENPSLDRWCDRYSPRHSVAFICELLQPLVSNFGALREPMSISTLAEQLNAYGSLRDHGLVERDIELLDRALAFMKETELQSRPSLRDAAIRLVREYSSERLWTVAVSAAETLRDHGCITHSDYDQLIQHINASRELAMRYIQLFESP